MQQVSASLLNRGFTEEEFIHESTISFNSTGEHSEKLYDCKGSAWLWHDESDHITEIGTLLLESADISQVAPKLFLPALC